MISVVAIAVFIVSLSMIIFNIVTSEKEKNANNEISQFIQNNVDANIEDIGESEKEILAYRKLATQNRDMVGWVKISGTQLDYLVLQTKNDPEYYLRRNFQKQYAASGAIFMEALSNANSQGENIILYGHNMKNKTMFGVVENYLDKNFWQQHQTISYNTLAQTNTYAVVAALKVDISAANSEGLQAYQLLTNVSSETYEQYINYINSNKLYETTESLSVGDSILTLSTCDNASDKNRLILVAKKIQ